MALHPISSPSMGWVLSKNTRAILSAVLASAGAMSCSSESTPTNSHPTQGPACTGSPISVTEMDAVDSAGDTLNNICLLDGESVSWKTGAPGTGCQGPADCAPVCCQCAAAGHEALTSWCDHGTCATAEQVCCALLGTTLHSCDD